MTSRNNPERGAPSAREGAPGEHPRLGRRQLEPAQELVEQPRLPRAGISHDQDECRAGAGRDPPERVPQHAQLVVATDHPRLDAFDTARRQAERQLLGPLDEVQPDRLLLPPHLHLAEGLDVEHPAHAAVRVMRDEHAVDRGEVLQSAGQVDGVAHHGRLGGGPHGAEVGEAGADADADRQGHTGLRVERGQLGLQRQPRPHGSFGVVLQGALRAPHRHHRITDVLVDPAAVFGHDQVEAGPDAVHHPGDELGVHPLGHRGEAAHVGEQHRHLAPPGRGGIDIGELTAQDADGDVEHIIGYDAPQ